MSKQSIIRAWKDENYRRSLSEAERAALPENPAGRVDLDELTAAELAGIDGGYESSRPGFAPRVDSLPHEVTPPRGRRGDSVGPAPEDAAAFAPAPASGARSRRRWLRATRDDSG